MKQDAQPTAPCQSDAFHQSEAKGDRRARPRRFDPVRRFGGKPTSAIDVVFLLLIFFLVTSTTFQYDEGSLQATMPGTTKGGGTPPIPVMIELSSADDGMTYTMQVDGKPIDGATELAAYLKNSVQTGRLAKDDLVQIYPQGNVRWQHVLNVYNACISAKLEQVSFSPPALADAGLGRP